MALANNYEQQVDAVNTRKEIAHLLDALRHNGVNISVTLAGSSTPHSSQIVAVESRETHFLIDAFSSDQASASLKRGDTVTVLSKLNGARLRFSATLLGQQNGNQGTLLQFGFPEKLHYYQRRKSYRLTLSREHMIHAVLSDGEKAHKALVYNISDSGVSLVIPQSKDTYQRLDRIPFCTLQFPGEAPYVCGLEVRRVQELDKGKLLISARFLFEEQKQRTRLTRLVRGIERNIIRSKRRKKPH